MDNNLKKEKKQEFFRLLKTDFSCRGFKRKGNDYFRFVNGQIMQGIHLQSSIYGDGFTVDVITSPIFCGGGDCRIGFYIKGEDFWWDYNCNINDVTQIIKEKIMPLFEEITTYDKLYEIIKPCLENDKPDFSINYMQGIFYGFSYENLFWLCVKYKNINACKKYINEKIKDAQISLDTSIGILSDEYHERIKKELVEYKKYKYLLENNFDKLLEILKEKERENLNYAEKCGI